MDVRTMANSGSNLVNPNITVTYARSTGYTIGAGARQIPSYAAPVNFFAQVQRLNQYDLKKFQHLTEQGVLHKIFARGEMAGIVRLTSDGGDLLTINGQTWAILAIVGQWSLWVEAIIVQLEASQS